MCSHMRVHDICKKNSFESQNFVYHDFALIEVQVLDTYLKFIGDHYDDFHHYF